MKHKFWSGVLLGLMIMLIFTGCSRRDSTEATAPSAEFEIPASTSADLHEAVTEPASESVPVSLPSEVTESVIQNETTVATQDTAASEHKHDYKVEVTKEPTCSASGVRTYTCKECGAVYMEVIEPLDHAFVITKSEPDCVNSGCTTYRCKECGYTYTENVRSPLGHSFGPMKTIQNPTELTPGLAQHSCIRCGEVENVVLPKLNTAS